MIEGITVVNNRNIISKELMDSIKTRDFGMTPLAIGQVLVLNPTGNTEEVDGKAMPLFDIGQGTPMNLATLSNFLVSNDSLVMANVGTPNECLKHTAKPTLLLDVIKQNNGLLPNSITVAARPAVGAHPNYFSKGAKGAIRAEAYKNLLKIDYANLETAPLYLSKAGDATDLLESWYPVTRVAVTADF